MQNKFFLLPFMLLLVGNLFAQQPAKTLVYESEKLMALGSRPSFRLEFSKADVDMVEKLWKDFVKEQYGGKLKKVKKVAEMSAMGAESSLISSDKFNIHSKVEKAGGDGVALDVWFDVGSYFLNRKDNPQRTEDAVESLKQFYYSVRRAIIAKEQEAEEDKLKNEEKKMKSLQKDKAGLQKDIEDYKAKIKKAEEDIVKNDVEQGKSQSSIEAQKKAIEAVRVRLLNVEREQ
jgi:hypothetical protein